MDLHDDAGLPADDDARLPEGEGEALDFGHDPAAAADPDAGEGGEDVAAPPPRRGAQERIDELTRLRREAERERDHWREMALRDEAEAAERANTEPDPADYPQGEADPAFLRDLGRFEARLEILQMAEAHQAQAEAQAVARDWTQRQEAFVRTQPDYVEVVYDGPHWPCTAPMADAIRTAEAGAAVAYHLARNPDEARRICGLSPLAQVREIGRLEARFGAAAQPAYRPASSAPGPAPRLKGQGGRFRISPDTDDFAAFDRAY